MDKIPPPPKSLTSSAHSLERNEDKPLGIMKGKGSFSYGCNNGLDEELMKLRREMVGLRQFDMSLLSQLNALKQSISEYKKALNIIVNGDDVENYGDFNQYGSSLLNMDQENDLPDDGDELDGEDCTSDDEREEDGEEENSERSSESTV